MNTIRKIIHIDMDCFYAAIEIRDNPALKGKPIAVGGSADRRGVLCTCSYEARKFGVRSAMATAYAKRLCPQLILLPVNMTKYKAVALEIRQLFYQYTDKVEPLSLDEAYLDVTQSTEFNGSATRLARILREQIFQQQQLTASAGIAPNKFLAKVASDWNKPNGQFTITPEQISNFISTLPINKIPGVGKVTANEFERMGIKTCQDLQAYSLEQLIHHFGTFGEKLYHYCRGIDHREVENNRIRKSVSVEETFAKDLFSLEECLTFLPDLFEQLTQRLKPYSERILKNQFVKIKFSDFTQTTSECVSMKLNFDLFKQLCETAYRRYNQPVRLLGIGVHFHEESSIAVNQQLALNIE